MFFPISFYRESRREAEQNTEEEEGYEKIQTWRMEEQNYGEVNGCNNSLQKKTNVCLFPSRLQCFILIGYSYLILVENHIWGHSVKE